MRLGDCRPHALVTEISEHGHTRGRSPNAQLASITTQLKLTAPQGSHSHAAGTVWELTHNGQLGVSVLAFGLSPGRYGIWLLGPDDRLTAIGTASVKHDEINESYDLPVDAGHAQQIVITAQASGQTARGRIVLRATLPAPRARR